ncbi:hypothetical protein AB4Z32_15730 [Massilia sp. 2TAF26]|uniref:hypothetical protein n=1 Tax=Massilia sp. 2TAF26 TaxID=3233012 RepID=UPI003F9E845C
MPTLLHITYFERTRDAAGLPVDMVIGEEAYDNIHEALMPADHAHSVYVTKRFSHDSNTRWHVEESCCTGTDGSVPMTYRVVLSKVNNPPEIYLDQSLVASSHKIHQVLTVGALVEVDYGFVQTVAHVQAPAQGDVPSNREYKDTIQHGEMHKRRLAIVVKFRATQVQVVPLSSVPPGAHDKTAFPIHPATLANLHFYGTSGKQTWGICGMTQTVSPSRLLPPLSWYTNKSGTRKLARNTKYQDHISASELDAMRTALIHAIGVTDYEKLRTKAQEAKDAATDIATKQSQIVLQQQQIAQLQRQVAAQNAVAARHEAVEELATHWAKEMGIDFEQQVQELIEMNAQPTQ